MAARLKVASPFPKRRASVTTTTTVPLPDPSRLTPTPEQKVKFYNRIGISADTMKPLFEAEIKSDPIKKLVGVITSRIKDGRSMNLSSYRIWAAIDKAYEAPFNQTTPTIVGHILQKGLKHDEILSELKSWGLSEATLFTETVVDGKKVKTLNEDTFFKTLVPLVKAYVTIRLAKLFNDRNQYPFFKYEPFTSTEENQSICEILTNLVERMSHQYGFPAVLRQTILQSLMYSIALVFPSEAWHFETDEDENGDEYTKKEGLRYEIPHPSRMFWDGNKRPSTFNTDTGCEFAGYWRIWRYGDVENNDLFWNKSKIPFGTNWFDPKVSSNYFTELYPCVLAKPTFDSKARSGQADEKAAFYATTDQDKAVFVTDIFMKLIPSQWGLGNWKHKVWFRFCVASDDTVIFAEPFPYCPVLYLGYDADENRANNPSLALEIIPWQDHLGNCISQILSAAKQNNAKIVYYDTEVVKESDIRKLKTSSRDSSAIHWIPYSSKTASYAQVDVNKLFTPVQFPQQDTTSLTNVMGTVISIMERLLGMSSSEVGAAGTHVQTAEEIRVISTNTSTRVDYTGSFVDDFVDAWKRQIYFASREFMDAEFVSQVSAVNEESMAKLSALGFRLGAAYDGKVVVRGDKSKLTIEAFVSTRDGQNRINSPQVAQVMMQTIQAIAGNQQLSQLVGGEQLLLLLNRAAILAGSPKDFKFKVDGKAQQAAQMQQLNQQLEQIAKKIEQQAAQTALKATEQVAKGVDKSVQSQSKTIDQITTMQEKQQGGMEVISEQVKYLQNLVGAALTALQPAHPQQMDTTALGA